MLFILASSSGVMCLQVASSLLILQSRGGKRGMEAFAESFTILLEMVSSDLLLDNG